MQERRFDIDAIRVTAIGLLIVYHTAVVFQPWGKYIGFITSDSPWQELWQPMSALNIWRIPMLFCIAGIALYFAHSQKRLKQLLAEKFKRIIVPFFTGLLLFVPAYIYLLQYYYGWPLHYQTHASHLWFLVVVFLCILLALPLFELLKKHRNHAAVLFLLRCIQSPWILPVVVVFFMLEALLIKPLLFELYANTWHGFFLGLLGLIWGYLFAMAGEGFWKMLAQHRLILLAMVVLLYSGRMYFQYQWPRLFLLPVESCLWMFSLFAFAFRYLSRPGRLVQYLGKAAYPVYVTHLFFLGVACVVVLPLQIGNPIKYLLLLLLTFAGSLGFYELAIKRINVLRFLFGMSRKN